MSTCWADYPNIQTGDIVCVMEPLHTRVHENAPDVTGTCLGAGLPTEVDIPAGTEARVERAEGRWGEDVLVLHFSLPGLSEFEINWGMERWPRMIKVRGANEPVIITYGLPFPSEDE